jgi:hypothetical protein
MKIHRFKTSVVLFGLFLILLTVWIGGCASTPPPARPDNEKIKRNSEKSMQDLKNEEDQRDKGY